MDTIRLETLDLWNQSDPFNKLPTEVILGISNDLTSVEELWSLVSSSRRCWDAFHAYPVLSLDMMLKGGTLHPCTHSVINFVFNLQTGGMQPRSYHHLRHIDSATRYEELTKNVRPEFVRRFVTRVRKIHALAHVILDNCMANLWMLEHKLRPLELQDDEPDLAYYLDICHNLGEETRIVLGLWLCELHATLVGANGHNPPPWVRPMLNQVERRFWPVSYFFRTTWVSTIWTIWHGLNIMHLPEDERSGPYEMPVPLKFSLPPLPKGGMEFGFRCTTELQNYASEDSIERRKAMKQELRRRPLVRIFLNSARGLAPIEMALHNLPVPEYLKTGLLIWDHEKVRDLGLFPRVGTARDDLFRYWKSLLPDKVILKHADLQILDKNEFWFHARLAGSNMVLAEPTDGFLYEDIYAQDDVSGDETDNSDSDSESDLLDSDE